MYKEVESLTDFSSLTVELQKAAELNENDFTSVSYDKLIGIVNQAQDILYDVNVTQEDVNQILEQLTISIDQLVTAGDNSQLMELINGAENLNRDEYTVDSYTILENTLNEAKNFVTNRYSQAEIDQMIIELDNAINDLVKTDVETAADKNALSIAIEMAEKADLENVVPVVVTEFNEALENAKAVYAKTNATQEEVNSAFDRLASAMQMLEFYQGDKTALQKQVDQINGLDESKYIESSWQAMLPVLDNANAVLADENAMQDEVDEVYSELVKAFLDLRLKPNKDLLNDLINKANGLSVANYSAETWAAVNLALENANTIMTNVNATEVEVEAAVAALNSAIEGLVANSEVPVETEVLSADEGVSSAVKAGDTTVSIKTGDSTSLGYSLAGLALASMVLVANKKRKY